MAAKSLCYKTEKRHLDDFKAICQDDIQTYDRILFTFAAD